MLERCKVCPSWRTEKAHILERKPKVPKKPTLKDRADGWSPKSTKYAKVIFSSCKKPIVEGRHAFVLA